MVSNLNGVFRGTVRTSIDQDPEGRMRVRVEVPMVHPPALPLDQLPLAEQCQDTGFMRGKFFPYRPGDLVWVMFEGGEADKPVIVGGQCNALSEVPDLPIDMQVDQSDAVVVETDDAGNLIVRDGRWDKRRLVFRSGGAEIQLTANGDRVTINATSGSVVVNAGTAAINATNASVDATRVDINTVATDAYGKDVGKISEVANSEISRNALATTPATDQSTAVQGIINDGGDVPKLRGVPMPPGRPLQTNKHNLRSKIINIGVGPTGFNMDADAGDIKKSPFIDYSPNSAEAADAAAGGTTSVPYPLLPTLEVNIRSSVSVNVVAPTVRLGSVLDIDMMSQKDIAITAIGDLDLTVGGDVTATIGGKVDALVGGEVKATIGGGLEAVVGGDLLATIMGSANATVGVDLTATIGGNVTAMAGGAVSVTTGAAVSVVCGGAMSILSAGPIALTAPVINLTGVVSIIGPLSILGPTIGMTGVLMDLHKHPYIDTPIGPAITFPPIPG
ncbi:MAG: Phage-related baseplate assembly protein [Firmicutes bacterium ADurb.Bin506]|nr:MAG: Phage-related baseplate assembly protein [Firmicutes bacterium ADurb.Bin506]